MTDQDTATVDRAADKLEAAMTTMFAAARELEAKGYELSEIGDAFLVAAVQFGRGLIGAEGTAKVLADLASKIRAGENATPARNFH